MPRYLNRNYYKLHAREIEDLLDRCLLVSPGTDFTENCQLSGAQQELYFSWELSDYKHLFENCSLQEDKSIEEELRVLCKAVPQVESVWESDKDVWEEWYELDEKGLGSYYHYEEFYPDNTHLYSEWVPVISEDTRVTASYFFEEMESCDFLSLHPDIFYPSVDKLVSRWSSKPVSDPLLGDNGEPLLTETVFLREDRELGIKVEVGVVTEEKFSRELRGDDKVLTIDGIVSLFEEPSVTGENSCCVDYIEQALQLNSELSPLSDVTDDKLREDISLLTTHKLTQLISQIENQLDISFTEEVQGTGAVISQQQDAAWVLESPWVDQSEPSLYSQLTTEHSILPLSPFTPRQFLSPSSVRRYECTLRSANQMPDEISKLMLAVPSLSVVQYYPTVEGVVDQLEMRQDGNVGSLDMELRWDPLTHLYDQIEHAKQLVATPCSLETNTEVERKHNLLLLREYQMENLTRYDTLLPQLDKESLDNSNYSQCQPVVVRSHLPNNDNTTEQKVQFYQHTAISGNICEKFHSQNNGLPITKQDSRTQVTDTLNQIDSIDSFLLLRQKRESPQGLANVSPTHPQRNHAPSKRICLMTSPKQASKIVVQDIPLNRVYREALGLLNLAGEPLLREVQEYGYLQDSSFTSLVKSPDTLQFLLREHKHQWLELDMPMGNIVWYKLRVICQLFCLVSSGAALIGTSLSAAIDVLFGSVNKYKVLVQDSLVTTGNSLVGMREREHNSFHPKIIQTISILLEKESTLNKCFNVGIIVFDIACTFNLASEMLEILKSQVRNLYINLIKSPNKETYNDYHEIITRAFDDNHCLLCESSALNYETFLWEKISMIILYNLRDTSKALSLIRERTHEDCSVHVLRTSMETDLETSREEIREELQKSSFIICSTKVSEEEGFLEMIESRCNLLVVERDYVEMGLANCSADIIVNESTGIVLVNLTSLQLEGGLSAVTEKLHYMKLAYSTCYVLAYTKSTEEYMQGEGPKILSALSNVISKQQLCDCKFELKGSTEIQGIAELIRTIVSQHSNSNSSDNEVEIEASEQEKWLVSLKCVNTCAAIYLLNKHTLKELIMLELSELTNEYPCIPNQCLQTLHQICSKNKEEWWNVGETTRSESNDCSSVNNDSVNYSYATSYAMHTVRRNHDDLVSVEGIENAKLNNNQTTNHPTSPEAYSLLKSTTKQVPWGCVGNNRGNSSSQHCIGSLPDGLLAFQKQQADRETHTSHINLLYQTDSNQLLDTTMDSNIRELTCKQMSGVAQTKLVFK